MKMYLEKLMQGKNLTMEEMKTAALSCLHNNVTESQIAALLTALQVKGETAEEVSGLAEAIRAQSPFHLELKKSVLDNCGTGGDMSGSFNISTTSAFVIAGAGVTVAKHGNRSISSRTGSADVLEHLGISLFFSKAQIEETLTQNNIAFLFAPHVHQRLKPFVKVRKNLGLPTIFNVIGPLTNPVELDSQLIGVYHSGKLEVVAQALKHLGRQRALVVNGAGGMDEASLAGENRFILLDNNKLTPFTLHPRDIGLPIYPNDAIKGGDAKENACITQRVLQGEPGAYMDTVLLNAGLALFAHGKAATILSGIELARKSILSGKALAALNDLISISKKISSSEVV
ncbi:anthranilate phosphoribosyltransferase [Virgibacillus dokdonensis]|uniref:Anthranilate phosphoribosyltransferase n=1 Tax=Virgibacillus dokdonensis TaxID=302167 RepID=A0A2K9IVL2_9BACI|nr:anthranilate phosphoribosyltransferase [Virgibacillus dokdonensis]AUJ23777.1 Anthranilate phosphoribosyltransferase 2 [Virgibacillus dokdonensis]